jgi:hypothetical protein
MKSDERLDYYLMVARLMAEAEAQMRVDALDRGSLDYATDLADLRRAVQNAEEAAARIAVSLVSSRIGNIASDEDTAPARH